MEAVSGKLDAGGGGGSGGGTAAWGEITGALANRTDLHDARDAKADAAELGGAAGKNVGTESANVAAGNRGLPSGGTARPDIDKAVLEVLTTGDVLEGTFEFSGALRRLQRNHPRNRINDWQSLIKRSASFAPP